MKHSITGCKCEGTAYQYEVNTVYPRNRTLKTMVGLATKAGCCIESCTEYEALHFDVCFGSRTYTYTKFVLRGTQEQIAEFMRKW